MTNKVDGVTLFEGNIEQFKNSGAKDDSPDSGISRNEIIALGEEMDSLKILQQKNSDGGGEDLDSISGECFSFLSVLCLGDN